MQCTVARAALLIAAVLGASERPAAPDFQLISHRGASTRLSDFRGNIVVLNFWATWCGPCRSEIGDLNDIHRDYHDKGVTVVGVAMDARGWPAVAPFIAQYGLNYEILLGTPAVARSYAGLRTLPRTLLLDRYGQVVSVHESVIDPVVTRKLLDTLLREMP